MEKEILKRNLPLSSAMVMLILLGLGGMFLCIVINLVVSLTGMVQDELTLLKMTVVLQNLLTFILPAFILVWFVSSSPFSYLKLDKVPSLKSIGLLLAVFIVMTPAMNYIVEWNESLNLPDSLQGLENWMKESENLAKATTDKLVDTSTIYTTIFAILTIGVLTGIGEEFFFRGALQGFLSRRLNYHLAVWISAFVFSLLHFQFYGFVPRMFLGAIFGYMFVWSGSLWLPIIAHALNNSSVVIMKYLTEHSMITEDMSTCGADNAYLFFISSVLTIALLFFWNRKYNKKIDE